MEGRPNDPANRQAFQLERSLAEQRGCLLDDGAFDTKMNNFGWMFVACAVCVAGFAGCKKQEASGPQPEYYGVKVEWPKLNTAFTNASPEAQASAAILQRDFRYGQFP